MQICRPVGTTLNIDDEVYRRIKSLAPLRGESGATLVTSDRGLGRFADLRVEWV